MQLQNSAASLQFLFLSSEASLQFLFTTLLSPHISPHLCTGYRSSFFLEYIFHRFTNSEMLAKILLAALAASPLVAAHGKVSVVVSNSNLQCKQY